MAATTILLDSGFSVTREIQKTYPDTTMTAGTETIDVDQTIITVNQQHTFSTGRVFESTTSSINNHATGESKPKIYAPAESMDEVETDEYQVLLTELKTLRDAIKVVTG